MTYHLRLKNAMSYTGVVKATREEPNVFTADEAVKAAALRSGYFELVDVLADQNAAAPFDADTAHLTAEGEQEPDGSTAAHFDREYLESLSFAELKRLAGDMGVPVTKTTKKAELVAAIAAETVTVPPDADDAEPDFGEA